MGAGPGAARALGAPSLRSLPAGPLAAAAATAVALGALATQTAPVTSARLAAVALAAGAALAVPDPAAPTVVAVPVARWLRVAFRLGPLLAGWVGSWAAVLALGSPPEPAALTAEAAVLLVSAVAVALLAERRGHPALAGAAAPLVLLGTGLLAPAPLSAFETVPALRPVLLAVTAAALAAIALSVADPGGRRLYHRR